jgi:hypothetical protein
MTESTCPSLHRLGSLLQRHIVSEPNILQIEKMESIS